MLHIFHGEDDFSRTQAVRELEEALGPEDVASLNVTRLEARGLTPNEVIAACDTVPFLAAGRLVVVDGLFGTFEGRRAPRRGRAAANAAPTDGLGPWSALVEYVPRMPPTTNLVLTETSIQDRNPLLAALRNLGEGRRFAPLRASDAEAWVRRRVEELGGSMEPVAVRSLVDPIGGNLWILSSEIEKLLLYCHGRTITQDDVETHVGYVKEGNIFALVDAFIDGRYAAARLQLRQLEESGVGAPQVVAMVSRQVRMLLQARDLLDRRQPRSQIQQAIGTRSDFVVDRVTRQARNFTLRELEEMHGDLLATDLSIKTGRLSEQVALELLLSDALTRRAGAR